MLLVAVTLMAYRPALSGAFVFDDSTWTKDVEKLLRDVSGLWQIWTNPTALQQYYPVTGSSFWIDYHLWHWWTTPYHVENALLHACSALLLWRLLFKLEVPGAWLAAAIFALHPVMAESVAWITERKNVLSMAFFLASLLACGHQFEWWKENGKFSRGRWHYWLALVLFGGAVLSKITALSLPAVVLLLAWWKRGRLRWREDVLPTIPFFALAIGLAIEVSWLEKHHVGAQGADWDFSWFERMLVAGRVPWFYAGKLLWPVNQCLIYPPWHLDTDSVWQWMFPLATFAVLLSLWHWRDRMGRGPATALFYFLGTLVPALGLMNFYWMRFSPVGDHLVYLSSPGLIALISAGAWHGSRRLNKPWLGRGLAAVMLMLLGTRTMVESLQYRDAETLWRTTLRGNPACWAAHNNLGEIMRQSGRWDDAASHYRRALQLKPDYADAHTNLGNFYFQMDRLEEARFHYEQSLNLNPKYSGAYNNLATVLLRQGQVDDAIAFIQKALDRQDDLAEAHNNLGSALLQKNRLDDAILEFKKALDLKPDISEVHSNLGNALLAAGKSEEAAASFTRALELDSNNAEARVSLGNLALRFGRSDEAMSHYQKAIESNPNHAGAHNVLGNMLVQEGKIEEAIAEFKRAVKINPDFADAHYDLGTTCYQAGRTSEAIEHLQRSLELNPNQSEAHNNLASALLQMGRVRESVRHYEMAVKINPAEQSALSNLAWILATSTDASLRDGARAVDLAREAVRLSGGNQPNYLHTLAAAYAEIGRFTDADETAERALALCAAQGHGTLAEMIRGARRLYQERKPLRELLQPAGDAPTSAP
jgi:tetratricopeptide (TPR) repeat protein